MTDSSSSRTRDTSRLVVQASVTARLAPTLASSLRKSLCPSPNEKKALRLWLVRAVARKAVPHRVWRTLSWAEVLS